MPAACGKKAEQHYPDADKIILVMGNANLRFEIHHTPKHGSALNMAELEIGIVNRQCLNRRIPTIEEMGREVEAWVAGRNKEQTKIRRQFTTQDARIKLHGLYPVV